MNVEENDERSLTEQVMELVNRQKQSKREAEYHEWCDYFESLPADFARKLNDGLIADVELQPRRWIQHGLDLIGSRKASGTVQLFGGKEGPDICSFLPYPVFQMGAEVFLKGMWLYQHEECRLLQADTYIAPNRRAHYLKEVKRISCTHDLLELVRHVEAISVYAQDAELVRFLKILGGISKKYYLPVSTGKSPWANERYPKRFYNDPLKVAAADALQSYPEHWPIARLFAEAADRLEFIWRTRS